MTTAADLLWRAATTDSLTIDDLPADVEGVRMELIDGSLSVTPSGDIEHQELTVEYLVALRAQLPDGLMVLPAANVIKGDQTLVIPDLVVADRDHLVRNGLGVTPEGLRLVVEITSRSTRRRDLTIKRELYREWGVPYLIVDRSTAPFALRVEGDLPPWAKPLLEAD